MFEDYKVVFCNSCAHSVFPWETYPLGTCCCPGKNKKVVNQRVPESCNTFKRKEKEYGKDK